MACSDKSEQFEVLINTPLFTFISQLFKNNYNTLEKDLLTLIANFMTFGDYYIDQLIDQDIFYRLLEGFSKTIFNKDSLREYLLCFRNIFRNNSNMKLANYIHKNLDLIDIFIEKIDMNELADNLKIICGILEGMILLAEHYRLNSDGDDNFAIEYIRKEDRAVSRLEMIQQHDSEEVYFEFSKFIDTYF